MKHQLFLIMLFFISLNTIAQEAMVYKVDFVGNKKLDSEYLKKIIDTERGTTFNKTTADKDLTKLKRLPSVANALYTKTLTNKGYLIRFKIEEKITSIPGANFYTTNNDEFAYRISFFEFNFLGKNITLGGFYQKDIFDSYSASFRAPFLFSKKFGIAFNYLNLTTKEPVFFRKQYATVQIQ